eukprot:8673185-Heterocapsa_arctica.AAC.1
MSTVFLLSIETQQCPHLEEGAAEAPQAHPVTNVEIGIKKRCDERKKLSKKEMTVENRDWLKTTSTISTSWKAACGVVDLIVNKKGEYWASVTLRSCARDCGRAAEEWEYGCV